MNQADEQREQLRRHTLPDDQPPAAYLLHPFDGLALLAAGVLDERTQEASPPALFGRPVF